MAEIKLETLEALKKFLSSEEFTKLKQITKDIDDLNAQIAGFKAEGATAQVAEFTEKLQKKQQVLKELNASLPAVHQAMLQTGVAAKKSSDGMGSLLSGFTGPLAGAVAAATSAIGKFGEVAVLTGSSVGRGLINPISETGSATDEIASKFGKAGAVLKNMEGASRNLIAVQTVAREALIRTGEGTDAANKFASEYPQTLRRMAVATGATTKTLHEMDSGLAFMGESALKARSGLEDITGDMGKALTPTAALSATTRAFGMDAKAAVTMATESYMKFNQSVIGTVRQLGVMADAAKQTGVDRKLASQGIMAASESLGIFGQKSGASARVWTSFMSTLGENVPLEHANKMVQSLTAGIAGMSVQNRAFIGMMSGMMTGASALGGALKMELMMRQEGGMEKNLDALTKSLSRFGGGQIITLEQAANNPQLEMQFQVQRQMLGKLAGVQTGEQQNRVLEVLQGVQRGGLSQVEGGRALQDVYKEGTSVQDKSLTALQRIEQLVKMVVGGRTDRQVEAANEALRPGRGGMENVGTLTKAGREGQDEHFGKLMESVGGNLATVGKKIADAAPEVGSFSEIIRQSSKAVAAFKDQISLAKAKATAGGKAMSPEEQENITGLEKQLADVQKQLVKTQRNAAKADREQKENIELYGDETNVQPPTKRVSKEVEDTVLQSGGKGLPIGVAADRRARRDDMQAGGTGVPIAQGAARRDDMQAGGTGVPIAQGAARRAQEVITATAQATADRAAAREQYPAAINQGQIRNTIPEQLPITQKELRGSEIPPAAFSDMMVKFEQSAARTGSMIESALALKPTREMEVPSELPRQAVSPAGGEPGEAPRGGAAPTPVSFDHTIVIKLEGDRALDKLKDSLLNTLGNWANGVRGGEEI